MDGDVSGAHGAGRDPRRDRARRVSGLGAIAHPVAVASLVLLVANDVAGKALAPGPVTGKLSDAAGLVVLPLVVAAALRVPLGDRAIGAAVLGVGSAFALMKTVPAVAAGMERVAELGVPSARVVVDPTDLLALPALALAWWVWHHPVRPRAWGIPVLVVAATWSMATSYDTPTPVNDVLVRDDGSFLVRRDAADVTHLSVEGAPTGRSIGWPDHETSERTLHVCLDDGTCVLADGHDVVEREPDGARRPGVDIPEERFDYASRFKAPGETFEGVRDLAANDHGVVVVAHGSHGISVRAADGSWSRPDTGTLKLTDSQPPVWESIALLALALVGLQAATWPRSVAWAVPVTIVLLGNLATALVIWTFPSFLVLATPWAVTVGLVVGLAQLVALGRAAGWRRAVQMGASYVLVWIASRGVALAWARGWIDDLEVVVLAAGSMVLGVTAWWVAAGRADGHWPVDLGPSRRPPVPDFSRQDWPLDDE